MFENMHSDVIEEMVVENIPEGSFIDQWDISGLKSETMEVFGLDLPIEDWAKEDGVLETDIRDSILERTGNFLKKKQEELGYETFKIIQKQIFLQVIDQKSVKHHKVTRQIAFHEQVFVGRLDAWGRTHDIGNGCCRSNRNDIAITHSVLGYFVTNDRPIHFAFLGYLHRASPLLFEKLKGVLGQNPPVPLGPPERRISSALAGQVA